MLRRLCFFCLCFCMLSLSYGQGKYFLCGPDEDGCGPGEYQWCLCMPYDGALAGEPYCLNFDNVSCVPLAQAPNCPKGDIFKDQGTCLAVAFQSEPEPPCPLVDEQFCRQHHVPVCQKDSGAETCHPM
ncbi:hypothetical protein [Coxiella burnetii]|uniref:Hypothetical exported protein n=1 Tax=Coxiella burnetii (strain Dugway 5J108-111) TaxID=434922 RepID=A9KCK2_COXBN|nr:hypothetical protein [Coxiella burnetii]ABS77645.1 hypothetical exported protein [Coxiella burnetii Dugway 5J108-111]ACJ20123.1 hypothetical exported protein [Coxiella burnetii CbuK_Q154]AIT63174.1 putative exported protein [Coxiella burnetii str. Namibia]ATN85764.1 hypothetical protein AYO29_04455 [Coxiella burnetii str. Schperling]EAX32247.1 hypothetical protein A35_04505 [Coxiella burnetii 'MSU Goat Q177']